MSTGYKLIFVPKDSKIVSLKRNQIEGIKEPHKVYHVVAKSRQDAVDIVAPVAKVDSGAPWLRGSKIKCVYVEQQ
jgi:hypothetical protein